MDEHHLDYAALTERQDVLVKQEAELYARITQAQTRLAELNVLKTHIVNYSKTKDIYVAYCKSGYLSADAAFVKLLEIYRRTEVAGAHTYSFPARTDPLAEGQFPLSSSHVVVPSGPFPAVF